MNTENNTIAAIALTQLKGLSLLNARILLDTMGSASEVMAHRKDIARIIPDATPRLVESLSHADDALDMAKREMEFVEKKQMQVLVLGEDDYPHRLRECEDAPLVLYSCGKADLNATRVISIVGTRKCSAYGREVCEHFMDELKQCCPEALIVSGLAYGIDICAHRAALENGMSTVGVLAHGLDMIYPSTHRQTAVEMVRQSGGLLTEYPTNTRPERINFVRRNRIVAGLCDACVVVESAAKGGSLITAELAMDYQRDVLAFPGRVYDPYSQGCNSLIRRQQATLLTSASDLMDAMGWPNPMAQSKPMEALQQELFPDLSDEERRLVDTLKEVEDKHVNQMSVEANIPYSRASMILFDLEMKGIVRALGGARYRLVRKTL